jgi:hypothetical protein
MLVLPKAVDLLYVGGKPLREAGRAFPSPPRPPRTINILLSEEKNTQFIIIITTTDEIRAHTMNTLTNKTLAAVCVCICTGARVKYLVSPRLLERPAQAAVAAAEKSTPTKVY